MELTLPTTEKEWLIAGLIYLGRICDVSMGTLRIIAVARGHRLQAVLLGCFEILIWLAALGQIMSNLTSIANYAAYAMGFASGIYMGMWLEQRVPLGNQLLRVIASPEQALAFSERLREAGFGTTLVSAAGSAGPVSIVFTILQRSRAKEAIDLVVQNMPGAFYTLEDVRFVSGDRKHLYYGTDPGRRPAFSFLGWRKSK